ncbi:hypothetical protein GGI21_004730 [Coemansia aciculifera]|nr:hypothetical protein GGI21_004730 [Coemansia aciculifera]
MQLDPPLIAILKRYSVFTPTGHPNLQSVMTWTYSSHTAATAYIQFILNIAPNAPARAISCYGGHDESLSPALAILEKHTSIQVLSLTDVSLLFWDAFSLVKALPLLTDLHTDVPTFGGLPQGIDIAELPEYVCSNFAPMAKQFRCWHFTEFDDDSYTELATYMLLLALVCPNFDYAALDCSDLRSFMRVMEKKIDEPGFSQYAPRLRRLLIDGRNGYRLGSDYGSDYDSHFDDEYDSEYDEVFDSDMRIEYSDYFGSDEDGEDDNDYSVD